MPPLAQSSEPLGHLRHDTTCHLCGDSALDVVCGYKELRRVTSDCKPWPSGGQLASCRHCGADQAVIDTTWQAEAQAIYEGYTIYHQAGGAEQAVFDQETGAAASRSTHLVECLVANVELPQHGRLLDVGCGNGAFLRAFAERVSGWSLAGSELSDRNRPMVERIPGVERLHVGQVTAIEGTFDLIAMVHVLEHLPRPIPLLEDLGTKLNPGGSLVIQVPDRTRNPFEILIADHATHFTSGTVRHLLERANYRVSVLTTDWVTKEISLVAGRGPRAAVAASAAPQPDLAGCVENVRRLRTVIDRAREAAGSRQRFGLFGSSIAATWLAAELGDAVSFFVDEDPARGGGRHLGRPIYHPRDVPRGSRVWLALPDEVAKRVGERLRGSYPHFATCDPYTATV